MRGLLFSYQDNKTIRYCLLKKNISVMALIILYENNGKYTRKVYRVLGCFVYTIIDNDVCIDYLSCQSKTLCDISSYPTFEETSFNLLLGIGVPELLLNLVYFHGFMTKSNSTVILNCRSRLINNYLSKGFLFIEHCSKQLSLITNDVSLRINLADQLKTDYVMIKNEAISAVANTIKQLYIHKNIHMTYKKTSIKLKIGKQMIFFLE